jgi:hypothetical protein
MTPAKNNSGSPDLANEPAYASNSPRMEGVIACAKNIVNVVCVLNTLFFIQLTCAKHHSRRINMAPDYVLLVARRIKPISTDKGEGKTDECKYAFFGHTSLSLVYSMLALWETKKRPLDGGFAAHLDAAFVVDADVADWVTDKESCLRRRPICFERDQS